MSMRLHVVGPVEQDELEGSVQRCLLCDAVLARGVEIELEVGERLQLMDEPQCPGRIDVLADAPGVAL